MEVLEHKPGDCRRAWLKEGPCKNALERVRLRLQEHDIPAEIVPKVELDHLFPGNHQGVVIELQPFRYATFDEVFSTTAEGSGVVLVLDQVQDPHNFGAIIRTAEVTGCRAVIVAKDKQAEVTPVVERASAGATQWIPIVRETNLARALNQLKKLGFWIYGLAGEEPSSLPYDLDLTGNVALVAGSEGRGLRPGTRKVCDAICRLPMRGNVSSYNVSVAVGMALGEVLRQQRYG